MTNDDLNFLTASTINLYMESLRRAGRVLLAPQDIPVLWDLIHTLTNPLAIIYDAKDTARTRELTEAEAKTVLEAAETSAEPEAAVH